MSTCVSSRGSSDDLAWLPERLQLPFGRLAAHPPGLVRVETIVVTDQMRALGPGTRAKRWSVLRELSEELQRVEDLEVPLGAALQLVAVRLGEGPARLLFGLVDHLPAFGHFHQPREAERAAGHVANQALDASAVAGGQVTLICGDIKWRNCRPSSLRSWSIVCIG